MLDFQETPLVTSNYGSGICWGIWGWSRYRASRYLFRELPSCMGWYRYDILRSNVSLEVSVTNQNRLYGHGTDSNGDWVTEGHCTGDDVNLRLQYVCDREEAVLFVGNAQWTGYWHHKTPLKAALTTRISFSLVTTRFGFGIERSFKYLETYS